MYRCPACDAALTIEDPQALKLHCASCGIAYLRIGGSLVTRAKDEQPHTDAPGYRCPACSNALEIEDLQAFKLRCVACQTEFRRVGGTLMSRAEYERDDPDRIPQARVHVKDRE